MDWRRIGEAIAVAILVVVAMSMFGDPRRLMATLSTVEPVPFVLALGTTVGGVLIWGEAYSILLRIQDVVPTPGRFHTVVLAGLGLRSLVPGGATTGPLVLGYVTGRATEATSETGIAMAYVLEVFLWVGTTVVGTTGFVAYLLTHSLPPLLLKLAVALGIWTVLAFGVILYGIRHPEPVEDAADAVVAWLRSRVEGRSSLLASRLDPDAVDRRLDRFFAAFRRLAHDPRHLSPALAAAIGGWFVHGTTMYLVARAIDAGIGYPTALVVVAIGGLTEGLSMLPGGIGVIKPAFVGLMVLLSPVGATIATTTVVLYRLSNYWFRIGVGFAALPVLGVGDVVHRSIAEAAEERAS